MKINLNYQWLMAALGILFPSLLWAGTAILTGYGEAKAMPELITVRVTVNSECYPTASATVAANDAIANQVLDIFKSYVVESDRDRVTATGGYVSRYTGVSPRNGEPVCVNKFKKQNLITFTTGEVSKFPTMFAALQDKIYGLGLATANAGTNSPTDFLEISTPQAELTAATKSSLERKALTDALLDAEAKFRATMASAAVKTYQITKYSENALTPAPVPMSSPMAGGAASEIAPVEFGSISIEKWLNVQFDFEGGTLNFQ